ncbi:hypothetical protein NP493_1438g00000 [Ridgeia piscesae]|uniref:Uncharacterized protein n=1 Tax=Ridgeia piscesae TaxID=27915 RepID=A0AAD9K4V3_RIDPI|nr:hypothetical protein NP493_1438g00000 [Ridgeia piscesae]
MRLTRTDSGKSSQRVKDDWSLLAMMSIQKASGFPTPRSKPQVSRGCPSQSDRLSASYFWCLFCALSAASCENLGLSVRVSQMSITDIAAPRGANDLKVSVEKEDGLASAVIQPPVVKEVDLVSAAIQLPLATKAVLFPARDAATDAYLLPARETKLQHSVAWETLDVSTRKNKLQLSVIQNG